MSTQSTSQGDSQSGSGPRPFYLPIGPLVVEAIALGYRANLPVLLWGKHGIGKSEVFALAAAKLGIGFLWRDLGLLEPPDLLGMPEKDPETGGMTYAPPAFLPREGRGLFLLEELNRCQRLILGPAMNLIRERQIGDYVLPPGWLPCAAANPEGEDYHVAPQDPALPSRFMELWCLPDVESWLAWAREHGVHHTIVDFVRRMPDVFSDPSANPRAWAQASQILHACDQEPVSDVVRLAGLHGVLKGEKWATALAAQHRQPAQPLEPAHIIDSYDGWRSAVLGWVKEGRTDLLRATMGLLIRHLEPLTVFQPLQRDPARKARVERFFADLPGDLRADARVWLEFRGFRGLDIPPRSPRRRRG
jgi:MoxR-like ATPase